MRSHTVLFESDSVSFESINISLLADGTVIESAYVTADNNWVVSFETGTPPLRLDHEAWYDADANWIKTVTDYPVSLVPQDIKDLLSSSEYGTFPLEDREVEFFETSSSGNFYRFDLRQGGREIKVDVHTNGAVTPAQYDMM